MWQEGKLLVETCIVFRVSLLLLQLVRRLLGVRGSSGELCFFYKVEEHNDSFCPIDDDDITLISSLVLGDDDDDYMEMEMDDDIPSMFSAILTGDSSGTITSTSHNERFIPPSTTYDDPSLQLEEIPGVPSVVFSDEKTGDSLGSEWVCGLRRSIRRRLLVERSQVQLGSVVVGGLRRSSRFV
jgi:hypothetical protein